MIIEIHQPELKAILNEGMKTGTFHSVEQFLLSALKNSVKPDEGRRKSRAEAIAHIRTSRQGNSFPNGVTLRELIDQGRD